MTEKRIPFVIDLLERPGQKYEVHVVDRAILKDEHVNSILGDLSSVPVARADSDNYIPHLGVDIFFDDTGSLRGVIFAVQSKALAIRLPASVAQASAKIYDEKMAARDAANNKGRITKGKGWNKEAVPEIVTPMDRLRKLLESKLAGFGMAQISLMLWEGLREKVDGVNLSTATSPPDPPPRRTLPEPINEESPEAQPESPKAPAGRGKGGRGGKGGKGGKGGRGGERGSRGGKQSGVAADNSRSGHNKPPSKTTNEQEPETALPVILPDDEEINWDRKILSPGEVVKKFNDDASRIDVNKVFIGHEQATDLEGRIVEGAVRAWISYVVADKLNSSIREAPIIKPSRLSDRELNFFTESMVKKWKVLGETSPFRKLRIGDYTDVDGMLQSNDYKTKIRPGEHALQYITYFEDGVEKTKYLHRPATKGKSNLKKAQLLDTEDAPDPEPPTRDGSNNADRGSGRGRGSKEGRQGQIRDHDEYSSEFQDRVDNTKSTKDGDTFFSEDNDAYIYGREEATKSELERDALLLRLLEGRGALRGPKYKDCAFIRRIWFPTRAQLEVGEGRKAKKTAPARKGKHDWMNADWDDDRDEEEEARIQAASLQEDNDDEDDQTEGEDVGMNDPRRGIEIPNTIPLNKSQSQVVARMVAPTAGRTRATLVHGPPGTGKTYTIAAATWILAGVGEPVWIIAQSNDGIRNVALKLQKVGFEDFILLVSNDYHTYRKENYDELNKTKFFPTSSLNHGDYQARVFASKAVLCTLATLSSHALQKNSIFARRPLERLIIDEASQIDMTSEFMHLFYQHRHSLQSVCWFGDPKQLPPFGWSVATEIQDIFQVDHLQANSRLLDTCYRLPIRIAKYISSAVYKGELKPDPKREREGKDDKRPVVFVDVPDGKEEGAGSEGKSFANKKEAEVLLSIVNTYYKKLRKQPEEQSDQENGEPPQEEEDLEYAVITPYEGQRNLIISMFKEQEVEQKVFNLDSFQGNEADYIITSIAKTTGPGFLSSINRLNVLLTRCKCGLVVVTQKDFVQRAGGLLQGLWFSLEPYDPWVSAEDVLAGYVPMPGSPAPNVRPPPTPAPAAPRSRSDFPPLSGGQPQLTAAQVLQRGLSRPGSSTSAPVRGAWGQKQGLSRVKGV